MDKDKARKIINNKNNLENDMFSRLFLYIQ